MRIVPVKPFANYTGEEVSVSLLEGIPGRELNLPGCPLGVILVLPLTPEQFHAKAEMLRWQIYKVD
jgi:hypothetical protein